MLVIWTPPEPELDEAEAIVAALGAGTPVNPALPDTGAGALIKHLAAFRDDIDREPLLFDLTRPARLD